jgi:hypothetical protein|tara:strand:- start:811 stop:1551 length:741 start_codon:yes stop_codon:yes gene_type:complete
MKKHLLKYLLEFLVIVMGISVSFWLNNWTENRLLNNQKKENLINLKSAIQKDSDLLETIESFNDFRLNSLSQVLKWSKSSRETVDSLNLILRDNTIWNKPIPKEFENDFFYKTITWIERPRMMIINSYAMEEIKSSGIYSKIKNKHLKDLVNDYYSDLYWVFGNDETPSAITDLRIYLRDNYNLLIRDLRLLNNPIKFINQDNGLILRLRTVINNAKWRSRRAEKSRLMSLKVIEELSNEIIKLED